MIAQHFLLGQSRTGDVREDIRRVVFGNKFSVCFFELKANILDRLGEGGTLPGGWFEREESISDGIFVRLVVGKVEIVVVFLVVLVPEFPERYVFSLDEGEGAVGLGLISHFNDYIILIKAYQIYNIPPHKI